jgi:hypothetical protein
MVQVELATALQQNLGRWYATSSVVALLQLCCSSVAALLQLCCSFNINIVAALLQLCCSSMLLLKLQQSCNRAATENLGGGMPQAHRALQDAC